MAWKKFAVPYVYHGKMNATFIENVHVVIKIGQVVGASRYLKEADLTLYWFRYFVILRDN